MYSKVYVVFEQAKTLGWIRKLLHSEISHCYVVFKQGRKWFKYDVNVDRVEICTLNSINSIIEQSIEVDIVESEGNIIALNTCVSSVKRFIGLRDWKIITPYQLFKRLNYGRTK